VAIGVSIITIFVDLYPRVMISSTNPAYSLTVRNSASTPYTLKVMTVIALVIMPVVLAYQSWTYYVFRRRISADAFRPAAPTHRPSVSAVVEMAARPADSATATASLPRKPRGFLRGLRRRGH
jgi:hypothetical protein